MPTIRPTSEIAAKWKSRAPQAATDYEAGVRNTAKDWAALTAAANDAYEAGIAAAIAAGRWVKGVQGAGTNHWRSRTLAVGPMRWTQGIQQSGDAYERAFAPYAEVIKNTTLPARGPRGSAGNYERSRIMGQALHERRIAA